MQENQEIKKLKKENYLLKSYLKSLNPFIVVDINTFDVVYTNSDESFCKSEIKKCYELRYNIKEPCSSINRECLVDTIRKTKEAVTLEHVVYKQNEEPQYIEITAHPIFNSEGELTQVIEYFTDITKRKKIQSKIQKLSSAVEQSANAIVITDLNGNIDYVNKKFCDLTGYSRDEVIGKNPRMLKSGKQSDEYYKELWETISSGKVWSGEFSNKKKNGELFLENVLITPLKTNNKEHTHYLAIKEDITEKKQNEKRLAELNATKDKFFSIIAHDLRSAFGTIINFSELLVQNIDKYDIAKSKSFAKYINDSSSNIFKLLENLLSWARSQTGGLKYQPEMIVLSDTADEIITLYEEKAGRKSVLLYREDFTKTEVFADIEMLKLVLRNLIVNALKYTEKHGKVWLDYKIKGDFVEISVNDTGVGIAKEDIDKLFTIAGKESTPGTEQEKGTGLGLMLCKEFVEKNGGKIRAESKLGQGSSFIFTVPHKNLELKDLK